jgi:RNA polymerase sigma-70 factor (ECF subfamily)
MNPDFEEESAVSSDRARFHTTRWSIVLSAGQRGQPESDRALAVLCETYWFPLYAEARRRGLSAEDAGDRVQGFFARLLEKNDLSAADRARGRFRSFLLASFGHYLSNQRDLERARKRGGGRAVVSLDPVQGESRYGNEPAHEQTPERVFDRRWALALIDRALGRLCEEYTRSGKSLLFETLKPALAGDRASSYVELAAKLGVTEGAIKTAVHRLRGRCASLIRDEVAQTVSSEEQIEDELAHLFAALEL